MKDVLVGLLAVAILFGLIAYLYYEVAVVLAMAAIGFALGTGLMVALGVRWSWAASGGRHISGSR